MQKPQRQYSHWDLVRMHFLDFQRQSKQHTLRQWQELTQQVLAQKPHLLEAATPAPHDKSVTSTLHKSGPSQKWSVEVRAGANNQPQTPIKNCA